MSIDPNVGGMSRHLSRLRSKPGYYAFKKRYRQVLESSQTGQKLYSRQPRRENGIEKVPASRQHPV